MQWNCPHCGTALSVGDSVVGSGWSFSRCYKCGGFALVRRAEINVIKVDKAPPGENVILPESPSSPVNGLVSDAVAQKYVKRSNPFSTKPKPEWTASHLPPKPPTSTMVPPPPPIGLPDPLPEPPQGKNPLRKLHLGIAIAASVAVLSGVYFYMQVQSLWKKAQQAASVSETGEESPPKSVSMTDESFDAPRTPTRMKKEPMVIAKEPTTTEREPAASAKEPVASEQLLSTSQSAPQSAPANGSKMTVRIRVNRASVHTGPGMEFPVTGTVAADTVYSVADWNNRWFKLNLRKENGMSGTGWVRNDLVQVAKE